MPPLPIQATWSPDVIATVVYRITMVFVSLAYIWRKYRQPLRTDDLHQLAEPLAARTPTVEGKSDETPEPSPANSIDPNNILQAVQAVGTLAAIVLGTTGCDGTSDTPTIMLSCNQCRTRLRIDDKGSTNEVKMAEIPKSFDMYVPRVITGF